MADSFPVSGSLVVRDPFSAIIPLFIGGLTATAAPPDFYPLLATPINSNTVRVYFNVEPRHISKLGQGDSFNRLNWEMTITEVFLGATIPVITLVDNALPQPTLFVGFLNAWSVDVHLDRRLVQRARYEIIASTNIQNRNNTATIITGTGFDRDDFPGIIEARDRQSSTVRALL